MPEVCRAAAQAIRALDPYREEDPINVPVLHYTAAVHSAGEDPARVEEVLAAVEFLDRLGAPLALPTLRALQDHGDERVRQAAGRALTQR